MEEKTTPKIKARLVEEMLGSPKEHLEESMQGLLKKIREEHTVLKEEVHEAEEVNKLWSTFAELEVEFDDIRKFMAYCFDFMPSSIEILSPEKLPTTSADIEDLLNDLVAQLHQYAMMAKNLNAENTLLKQQLAQHKKE